MELGRLGRGGQRQVRGLADRPPGVAHGGGDNSLSLARSDLRRAERHLHAGGDSILAEMMELGRLGRGGQRQVRGLADRPPGVAHGGGDNSLSLARSDLRRAERHLHAGGDSILAEMMELGRLGRGGQRQVRGLADRPPGVAHGGGDNSLSLARSDLRRAERHLHAGGDSI